jgi:hypothetical protein
VKFEGELSISILRNKTTLQKIGAQNRSVQKVPNFFKFFKTRHLKKG